MHLLECCVLIKASCIRDGCIRDAKQVLLFLKIAQQSDLRCVDEFREWLKAQTHESAPFKLHKHQQLCGVGTLLKFVTTHQLCHQVEGKGCALLTST